MGVPNEDRLVALFDYNSTGAYYDANSKYKVLGRGIYKGGEIEVRNSPGGGISDEIWLTIFYSQNSQGLLTLMEVDKNLTSKFSTLGKNYVVVFSKLIPENPSELFLQVLSEADFSSLANTDFIDVLGTITVTSLTDFSSAVISYEERGDLTIERSPVRGGVWEDQQDILDIAFKKNGDFFVYYSLATGYNLLVYKNGSLEVVTGQQLSQLLADHRNDLDAVKHVSSSQKAALADSSETLSVSNKVLRQSDRSIMTVTVNPLEHYGAGPNGEDRFELNATELEGAIFNLEIFKEQIQVLNNDGKTPLWDANERRIVIKEIYTTVGGTIVFDPSVPGHITGGAFVELTQNVVSPFIPKFALMKFGKYKDLEETNVTPGVKDFVGGFGTIFSGNDSDRTRKQLRRFVGHLALEHENKIPTTIREIIRSEFASLPSSVGELLYITDEDTYVWKKGGVEIPFLLEEGKGDAVINSVIPGPFNVNMVGYLNSYTADVTGGVPFSYEWKVYRFSTQWDDVSGTEIVGVNDGESVSVQYTATGDYKVECRVVSYEGGETVAETGTLNVIAVIANISVDPVLGKKSFFIFVKNDYSINTSDNGNANFEWLLLVGDEDEDVSAKYLTAGANPWEIKVECSLIGLYTLRCNVTQIDNGSLFIREINLACVMQEV